MGQPAIVEPLDVARPLLAASQLRSQGLSQQLAQSQLAEREQSLARQEQIRGLYALDQPQTSAAPSQPGPLVENGQTVPPRVGEGLSPALSQQSQVPTWRRAMAIDPATGLKLREGMAAAESAEGKARDERLAYMGQVAYGILEENTQAAYDQGIAHLRQTFGNEFMDALNLPTVYNPAGVRQFYNRSLTAQDRVREAQVQLAQAKASQQVPEYTGDSTLNVAISRRMQEAGLTGTPPPHILAQVEKDLQEGKVQVSAAQGREQAQQRTMSETAQKVMTKLDEGALTAQDTHTALDEIDRLIGEGVYGATPTERITVDLYRRGLNLGDEKARRTVRVQELGNQLVLARGSLGSNVSNTDAQIYARAAGNFQNTKSVAEMQESIKSMRAILNKAIDRANTARQTYQNTGQLPSFERGSTGVGGTSKSPAGLPHADIPEAQLTREQRQAQRTWLTNELRRQ
jgi:hypothetical protein